MEELSPVKKALLEVRNLRAKLAQLENRSNEPIAVIGMGLRLPGEVDSPEAFWELLRNGVDAVTEVPAERWDNNRYYDSDYRAPGKVSTRHGSFLKGVDQFDAAFFGISPREAESMDPQHRLLLEVTWEALERAGQSPAKLMGSETGVFLGISNSDYQRLLLSDLESIDPYVSTGNLFSVAAGRLSYILGLHGPNIAIDTACSSSLVAVHLAVQSLRLGECNLALVGGVSLMLSPAISVNFSKAQMMASDGRCKTFDAAADGYVRGEGCIVIALKRLSAAIESGDPILAVIRGTAINHDGRSGGLTAPNGPAQTEVIRHALANAGLQADNISYVETHGTGTSLGDPIEVGALVAALAKERDPNNPLMLGSVKTNLGHLEAAAGLAGLVKVILSLQQRQIPPHLHLR
jgi:acyl transferase domain-containing protein